MIKALVRLALASEYSRLPIRRADISTKVLGTQGRQFKTVFDGAQLALRQTFGMEMVELPAKEKVTMQQKRAAQKSGAADKPSSTSKSWILYSILPEKFRIPEIMPPPKVPTQQMEEAYVGLYSFVVSVIMLAGGRLPEAKLERYLKRTNADQSTPVDTKEKVLARMEKEGYIQRVREMNAGEETVEYLVGPRGKMEVGEEGMAGMVKMVYGNSFDEEAKQRLERSLKSVAANNKVKADAEGDRNGSTKRQGRGRPRKEAGADNADASSGED